MYWAKEGDGSRISIYFHFAQRDKFGSAVERQSNSETLARVSYLPSEEHQRNTGSKPHHQPPCQEGQYCHLDCPVTSEAVYNVSCYRGAKQSPKKQEASCQEIFRSSRNKGVFTDKED